MPNTTTIDKIVSPPADPADFLNKPYFLPNKKVVAWNQKREIDPPITASEPSISNVKKLANDPKTGKFLPGHAGFGGKTPGRYDFFPELVRALRRVEKEKGISIIEHAWNRSFQSDVVLIAMLKKVLPDLTSETGMKGPQIVNIVLSYEEGSYPMPLNGPKSDLPSDPSNTVLDTQSQSAHASEPPQP